MNPGERESNAARSREAAPWGRFRLAGAIAGPGTTPDRDRDKRGPAGSATGPARHRVSPLSARIFARALLTASISAAKLALPSASRLTTTTARCVGTSTALVP